MTRAGERGFSLLEVLFATALTIGVVLATTTAVVNALHASSTADIHMSLNDDALSAISDVRAMSAYDSVMFGKLRGRTATMTRPNATGGTETIAVAVTPIANSTNLLATATVSEGNVTVTQAQTLYLEAPPPGSSVNQ